MRPPPPDFVVVGAPKCGTTAVHATLQQHAELFLSQIKEPHYFAYDLPGRREVETIEDYDRLFALAGANQLRGETSAHYLSSTEAIAAILERRPDAKFIALVRNPLDMFVSWHNECLKALDEDEQDPELAWMLQEERAQGRRIPKLCKEPAFLQYKKLCSLGAQIESLVRLVPETQRLVMIFDDLQENPRGTYQHIVDFLDIKDDGTDRFVRENLFAQPKSALIARVIRFAHLNPGVKKLRIKLKPVLNKHGIRPIGWLLRHNLRNGAKPVLSQQFRWELEAAFTPDVQLLERLLCRNFREFWHMGDGVVRAQTGAGDRSLVRQVSSDQRFLGLPATRELNWMLPIVELPAANKGHCGSPEPVSPRVIMAMMGSREHYQSMKSAHERGSLARFITDFWYAPEKSTLNRILPAAKKEILRDRFANELRYADVVALTRIGVWQYLGLRVKRGRDWRYKVFCSAGRRFAQACNRHLDVPHTTFVGYTSTALEALEHENRSGVLTVLDQIDAAKTGEEIMLSEMQRHKQWVLGEVEPIPNEYYERLSAEWSVAKRVIVNSAWSQAALIQQGVPAAKISVCPLAYDPPGAPKMCRPHRSSMLKVLWLGRLCLGKGIAYALEAARRLERHKVDFTFAGPLNCRLPNLPGNCRYVGKLTRPETVAAYCSHDVFIFPTLSDGFGLTQLEAMAHGLPVIATPNCGDVVEHGISGLLVPPRDSRAIAEAVLEIGMDPGKTEAMSGAALRRSADFTPDRVWTPFQSSLI